MWFRGKQEERPKGNKIFVLAAQKWNEIHFSLGLCLPFLVLCCQNCTETLATQARIPYLKTELTNSEQQRRVQRCREARLFKNLQERGMMVIMEVFAM